jgi:hypothetical protein
MCRRPGSQFDDQAFTLPQPQLDIDVIAFGVEPLLSEVLLLARAG